MPTLELMYFLMKNNKNFPLQAKNTGVIRDNADNTIDESLVAAIQLTGDTFY